MPDQLGHQGFELNTLTLVKKLLSKSEILSSGGNISLTILRGVEVRYESEASVSHGWLSPWQKAR